MDALLWFLFVWVIIVFLMLLYIGLGCPGWPCYHVNMWGLSVKGVRRKMKRDNVKTEIFYCIKCKDFFYIDNLEYGQH